jgi:hypothetical protein
MALYNFVGYGNERCVVLWNDTDYCDILRKNYGTYNRKQRT